MLALVLQIYIICNFILWNLVQKIVLFCCIIFLFMFTRGRLRHPRLGRIFGASPLAVCILGPQGIREGPKLFTVTRYVWRFVEVVYFVFSDVSSGLRPSLITDIAIKLSRSFLNTVVLYLTHELSKKCRTN